MHAPNLATHHIHHHPFGRFSVIWPSAITHLLGFHQQIPFFSSKLNNFSTFHARAHLLWSPPPTQGCHHPPQSTSTPPIQPSSIHLGLEPTPFQHFGHFYINFSPAHRFLRMRMLDLAITHPSIFIDFLSNSVDFCGGPMPLGQQSITPSVFL